MTGVTSEQDQDDPHQQIYRIVKGTMMLKAGRMGRPHFRQFRVSKDLKYLQWDSPNKEKIETRIDISEIKEIIKGQKTKVFEGNPIPEYEAISFSIMYSFGNQERSLDIVCKDRAEYDVWTAGLEALRNGFNDLDAVSSKLSDIEDGSSKLSLEFGIISDRVSVKEDACDIYTWGASTKGTLGHGEAEEELVPRVVEALLGRDIRKIACGFEHTLAVSVTGEVFSMGSGRGGKLGDNIHDRYMPLKVGSLSEKKVVALSCSELHSAVVTSTGELYSFGRTGPRLGYSIEGRKQEIPKQVDALKKHFIVKVSCGLKYTLALTKEGQVFAFGENGFGQLGLGHRDECKTPTKIKAFDGLRITQISAGMEHAGAVTENGDVWLWGNNDFGQLGTGDTESRDSPHEAPSTFWNEEIQDIKCGGKHTVVLSCTGKIYCFGDGQYGQLGVNLRPTQTNLSTPCNVPIPSKVVQVDCGIAHTAAVTDNGTLYTWGKGSGARLGHSDHRDRTTPTLVESLAYKNVQSIACGAHHTAASVIRAWVHDQEAKSCMACKLRFTTVRRKHHCRKCGGVFCNGCTSKKFPILEIGYTDPVRVCDRCYNILSDQNS
ncbi:uncharacterized protein [Clytia hemisphaerica]|uniref:FYVE-type domain-containing protein n=1 Tax=Clytia hemisphaerica TaxID=252671 RepID=A0A7M5X0Y9_9CNID|eukprot:TCONS_00002645-protein